MESVAANQRSEASAVPSLCWTANILQPCLTFVLSQAESSLEFSPLLSFFTRNSFPQSSEKEAAPHPFLIEHLRSASWKASAKTVGMFSGSEAAPVECAQ